MCRTLSALHSRCLCERERVCVCVCCVCVCVFPSVGLFAALLEKRRTREKSVCFTFCCSPLQLSSLPLSFSLSLSNFQSLSLSLSPPLPLPLYRRNRALCFSLLLSRSALSISLSVVSLLFLKPHASPASLWRGRKRISSGRQAGREAPIVAEPKSYKRMRLRVCVCVCVCVSVCSCVRF